MVALRVLMVNKFWYRRAGLERVMFDEIRWLEDAGHEVGHFSADHPENDQSPWSDYFVPYLELGVHTALVPKDKVVAARRMFWNEEAARRFKRLLRDFRPAIIHVHGIHRQISPSILHVAREAGIPVVQSLHDYHPICPADDLLLAGAVACDPVRCGRFNVLPCALHRCVQRSSAKSALAAAELLWRRWVVRVESLVEAFISPSRYLATTMAAGGVRRRPIHVVPNAIPVAVLEADRSPGEAFVYAGRLSREKGLITLLRAAERAHVPLLVAGEGPLGDTLAAQAPPNVSFLGRLPGEEIDHLLAGCRAAVVPSEWAENAPMAVLEPMAVGRPVIATRMGGIPEQLRDGVDGILVRPGDDLELAAALRVLADDAGLADRLGRSARARVEGTFDPQTHTAGLLAVYSSALNFQTSVAPPVT